MWLNGVEAANVKSVSWRLFCTLGLAAISFVMIAGPSVFAQSTGTILGTLKDPTGASISGAAVSAVNEGTSLRRSAATDTEGNYVIPLLPVGSYRVEVEAQGFKSEVRSGIDLHVASQLRIDFSMQVG